MYYKYLSDSRLSFLDDELIRFTQPGDLNDPFECMPQKPSIEEFETLLDTAQNIAISEDKNLGKHKDQIQKMLKSWKNDIRLGLQNNVLDGIFNTAKYAVNEDLGILSLSKNWNKTLMWSHYANSHKGICVGFNSQHSFFDDIISNDGISYQFTNDVTYSKNRVKISITLEEKKLSNEPYITKSLDWEYEEEVRVISSLNRHDKLDIKLPFNIYLFKVPHNALTEIILGAGISIENKTKIMRFCQDKEIEVFQSKISDRLFDMERVKI